MEVLKHKRPNNSLLVWKGMLAIIWGILALIFATHNQNFLITSFGLLNLIACSFTMLYVHLNYHLKIAHQWLILEGLTEGFAGMIFLFLTYSTAQFLEYLSFGILFVVVLQFIYGFYLLMANVLHLKNLVARVISLIAGGLIAISILGNFVSPAAAFIMVGIFSIIFGILNIQFAYKLQNIIMGETR